MKKHDFAEIFSRWEASEEGKKQADQSERYKEREVVIQQKGSPSLSSLKSMKPQAELDLHGYTASEAKNQLHQFLRHAQEQGLVKVRIVHGRGLHSPQGHSVLRAGIHEELEKMKEVRAFGYSRREEGGIGSTWVIIKK